MYYMCSKAHYRIFNTCNRPVHSRTNTRFTRGLMPVSAS